MFITGVSSTTPSIEVNVNDHTQDWNAYINTKEGYSLKYPSQVSVDQYGNFNLQNGKYKMAILSSNIKGTNLYDIQASTLDQVVSSECPNWTQQSCSPSTSGPMANSLEFDLLNRHYSGTNILLIHNTIIYEAQLGAINPNTPVDIEAKQLFEKIISTIKFN